MALVACRECQHEVSWIACKCPYCRAPNPARVDWQGAGREWKSSTTIWGYPLIHIAYGRNAQGKLRVAKGVIAIGQFALGYYALGYYSWGVNHRDIEALTLFARFVPFLQSPE